MPTDPANYYEEALRLAESGSYEQAIEAILKHLQMAPDDGKAVNDAGTILFCLKRGREAIAYFEKAELLCQGDEQIQVYWNLCEAYIQEGYPGKAAAMFDVMRQSNILNVNMVNQVAEAFLQKNDLGRAMESLRLSLKLVPNQDILTPMLEVIRSKRQPVSVIASGDSMSGQMLAASLDLLTPTTLYTDGQVDEAAVRNLGTMVFFGLGVSLVQASHCQRRGGTVVILREKDFYHPLMAEVDFSTVDVVVACAPDEAVADLHEQIGTTTVVRAEIVPDVSDLPVYRKRRGKRIAAVGPWDARNNPMFLLHAFQKLHYLDADYRLYLAGGFEDAGVERYMHRMVEVMDLENEVIFDSSVKNMGKWLKDKHYSVSTAIDSSAMDGVWAGMAYGLKPVVHRFAGVRECFDEAFVFDLAEDFCEQIRSNVYESVRYRRLACERFEQAGLLTRVHSLLSDFEKETQARLPQTALTPQPESSCMPTPSALSPISNSVDEMAREVLAVSESFAETSPLQGVSDNLTV